jgi:hypothetical protein|eukprot:COSAG06_NODE_1132_length_10582_cov_5.539826_11_plen_89_part_00
MSGPNETHTLLCLLLTISLWNTTIRQHRLGHTQERKIELTESPGVALRASLVGIAVSTQYHERRRRLGASARPIVSGEPMATPDSVEE